MRREIEVASESRRNIVPLMFEGFDFSSPAVAKHFKGSLEPLTHYNGLSVPAEYFEPAMEKLRTWFLNVAVNVVVHPMSAIAQDAARTQRVAADGAPSVETTELTAEQWLERGSRTTAPEVLSPMPLFVRRLLMEVKSSPSKRLPGQRPGRVMDERGGAA